MIINKHHGCLCEVGLLLGGSGNEYLPAHILFIISASQEPKHKFINIGLSALLFEIYIQLTITSLEMFGYLTVIKLLPTATTFTCCFYKYKGPNIVHTTAGLSFTVHMQH